MDAEWFHMWQNGLMWWPGPLPQRIQEVGSVEHDSTDRTIVLEATTDVFYIPEDEELGAYVAKVLNDDFYFGSFYWSDDVLRVSTSLAWNNDCRELLTVFRQACLQQTTRANQVALAYLGIASELDPAPRSPFPDAEFIVCEQPHPTQGMRFDVDEMLTIYAGAQTALPTPENLPDRVEAARETSREVLHEVGFTSKHGPSNAEWLTDEDIDILIRPLDDASRAAKYGPGLILRAPVMPASNEVSASVLGGGNNRAVGNTSRGVSLFGPVVWDEHFGIHVREILDAAALAGTSNLATLITNAVLQLAASVQVLRPDPRAADQS
ncbi:hypothetical protein [Flexivirga lutea]